MDIHHAMIVRNRPDRLYEALTQPRRLEVWMDAPVLVRAEARSTIEFQYDQGRRPLKVEVTRLDPGKRVQWRVAQPVWPVDSESQVITWTLTLYESSTLVDFRMDGWPQDDDVYSSVSYKWAMFMMRLKIYMGDHRDVASLLTLLAPGTVPMDPPQPASPG